MPEKTLHERLFDIGNRVQEDMATMQKCYRKLDAIAKLYAMKQREPSK